MHLTKVCKKTTHVQHRFHHTAGLSEGTDCRFQCNLVTNTEIETCLRSLKRKKSSGLDNISPFVLKDCLRVIALTLSHLINLSFTTGVYPTEWKTSKVIPIYKKGRLSDLQNYRPISIELSANIMHVTAFLFLLRVFFFRWLCSL